MTPEVEEVLPREAYRAALAKGCKRILEKDPWAEGCTLMVGTGHCVALRGGPDGLFVNFKTRLCLGTLCVVSRQIMSCNSSTNPTARCAPARPGPARPRPKQHQQQQQQQQQQPTGQLLPGSPAPQSPARPAPVHTPTAVPGRRMLTLQWSAPRNTTVEIEKDDHDDADREVTVDGYQQQQQQQQHQHQHQHQQPCLHDGAQHSPEHPGPGTVIQSDIWRLLLGHLLAYRFKTHLPIPLAHHSMDQWPEVYTGHAPGAHNTHILKGAHILYTLSACAVMWEWYGQRDLPPLHLKKEERNPIGCKKVKHEMESSRNQDSTAMLKMFTNTFFGGRFDTKHRLVNSAAVGVCDQSALINRQCQIFITMYNLDVDVPKEELHNAIVQELRLLGLKNGSIPKRSSKTHQNSKGVNTRSIVFRKPLQSLPSKVVQLQSGVEAEVPNIVHEICCCVVQQGGTEGIFRKAGSTARQKEIRVLLDQGHKVQFSQHHVIDIANLLKFFLRELPEPVLPFAFHDLFLHCLLLDDTAGAALLVSLLLPRPHLHVLAYLMEFFHLIAGLSELNKMNTSNLAIVLAPSLMPVSEKVSVVQNPQRISAHVRIIEVLMSNAERIGVLPDGVVGKLNLTPSVSNLSLTSEDHSSGLTFSMKKKRRRSGSLTRMFNGLKKIVVGKPSPGTETDCSGVEDEAALVSSTTDLSTPCVKSAKKRKAIDTTSAFSSKKKRDVLMALPQSTALADTPFKKNSSAAPDSTETPRVCPHPNPLSNHKSKSKSPQKTKHRKFFQSRTNSESDSRRVGTTSKKGLAGVSSFVIRKQKNRSDRHSTNGNFLERSWSAVSSSSWGRKKLRQSDQTRLSILSTSSAAYALVESDSSHDADMGIDLSQSEDPFDTTPDDFVHVPKSEYEDLKCRLSAIESCISQEFSSVSTSENKTSPDPLNAANTLLAVQNVYEKTLEDADITKDSSTDQLAKRLSRELKIRRSSDGKVMRSPSARKIGSIRRRSRERQSPSLRRELRRNKSWHMMQRPVNVTLMTPSSSMDVPLAQNSRLRRGRPNTVFSGLPHPTPNRISKEIKNDHIIQILGADSPVTRSQARRASSFHGSEGTSPSVPPYNKKCKSQVNLAKAALLAHAQQKNKVNLEQDEKWRDAQELLSSKDFFGGGHATGRESIAKLRSENAGKVLATAKLFNASTDAPKQVESRRSKTHESHPPQASLSTNEGELTKECTSGSLYYGSGKDCVFTDKTNITKADFKLSAHSSFGESYSTAANANQKLNGEKNPIVSNARRLRGKISPTQSPAARPTASKVKKHSSMKTDRVAHSQPVKRNLSVPVELLDTGKENQVDKSLSNVSPLPRGLSPQGLKETVPLTERIQRISVSPLKDCNRISVQLPHQATKYSSLIPCTPNIKQPLTTLTPRRKAFTPQAVPGFNGHTPLKVLATPTITPIQLLQHRSSRLQQHTSSKTLSRTVKPFLLNCKTLCGIETEQRHDLEMKQ
ncbi:Rho GTPase-activating protein 11A [Frankliniella fusca]|uniref:Rho GTPase-activating protein 11A n=1 Tax=Frankliniella fusca TaxID=407009 RepID=A0AAE1LU83_9NEOP|nr:Rho GTPase-activating protein 11A [Frankliniella fusca]